MLSPFVAFPAAFVLAIRSTSTACSSEVRSNSSIRASGSSAGGVSSWTSAFALILPTRSLSRCAWRALRLRASPSLIPVVVVSVPVSVIFTFLFGGY